MNDPGDMNADLPELPQELQAFAVDLSRLRPRDDRLDRERLAFLAGRASAMSEAGRTTNLLGLPLENRAWPAAFAAMTAIAASLVFVLCLRSNSPKVGPTLVNKTSDRAVQRFPVDDRSLGQVLSTRDAYLPNFESRLLRRERERIETGAATPTIGEQPRPVLTPTAWDQAINGAQPSRPSPNDASGVSPNQGANS